MPAPFGAIPSSPEFALDRLGRADPFGGDSGAQAPG